MQLPGPVRAVIGLMAVAADEARRLPDRAVELPMLAVSSALQASLRAQQRYARLAARGDDVLNRRPPTDEPPPWATFDEPVPADERHAMGRGDLDPGLRAASQLLDELLGVSDDTSETSETTEPATPRQPAPRKAAAKKPAAAEKAPAKAGSAAKKQPAKKVSAAQKTQQSAAAKSGKTINAPRHTTPSRFDTVDDD